MFSKGCAAIANSQPLLQMPWTHMIFFNLIFKRANWDLVFAQDQFLDFFAAIARVVLLFIQHYVYIYIYIPHSMGSRLELLRVSHLLVCVPGESGWVAALAAASQKVWSIGCMDGDGSKPILCHIFWVSIHETQVPVGPHFALHW